MSVEIDFGDGEPFSAGTWTEASETGGATPKIAILLDRYATPTGPRQRWRCYLPFSGRAVAGEFEVTFDGDPQGHGSVEADCVGLAADDPSWSGTPFSARQILDAEGSVHVSITF